jgi:hypothetical protein
MSERRPVSAAHHGVTRTQAWRVGLRRGCPQDRPADQTASGESACEPPASLAACTQPQKMLVGSASISASRTATLGGAPASSESRVGRDTGVRRCKMPKCRQGQQASPERRGERRPAASARCSRGVPNESASDWSGREDLNRRVPHHGSSCRNGSPPRSMTRPSVNSQGTGSSPGVSDGCPSTFPRKSANAADVSARHTRRRS